MLKSGGYAGEALEEGTLEFGPSPLKRFSRCFVFACTTRCVIFVSAPRPVPCFCFRVFTWSLAPTWYVQRYDTRKPKASKVYCTVTWMDTGYNVGYVEMRRLVITVVGENCPPGTPKRSNDVSCTPRILYLKGSHAFVFFFAGRAGWSQAKAGQLSNQRGKGEGKPFYHCKHESTLQ